MVDAAVKVMIGLPTAEFARRADFYDHLNVMDKPDGTMFAASHGQSPAQNRNVIIEQALENDCTHIFLVDDDIIVQRNTLAQLLAHNLDIVGGHYLMRNFPHQALIFDKEELDGSNHWWTIDNDASGVVEVTATGLGCVLFKSEIFLKLPKPWVRMAELEPAGWSDDIGLFNRIRKVGFKIHVDLDMPVGHISSAIITPIKQNDLWHVSYATNGPQNVTFPMVRPNLIEEEEKVNA